MCSVAFKITSLLGIDQVIKEYQIIIYDKKIINIIRWVKRYILQCVAV